MAQVHVDEVMLREPNLLVPGRPPVGMVRVDWSNPLTAGLQNYWPLHNSNQDKRDIITNQFGTFKNNAKWSPVGLDFDGVNDGFYPLGDQDTHVKFGSENTFIYWCYSRTDKVSMIFGAGGNSYDYFVYHSAIAGALLYYRTTGGTAQYETFTGAGEALTLNRWTNIAFTRITNGTDSDVSLYINGVFHSTQGGTIAASTTTQVSTFGCEGDAAGSNGFDGLIRNVMGYTRVLSAAEIAELYRDPYQILIPA